MALIQIRQKKDPITEIMDVNNVMKRNAYPGAHGGSYLKKNYEGWLTGLSQEEEEKYGKILNQDLSKTSDYWVLFFVPTLAMKGDFMTLNDEVLEDKLRYKAAIASKIIAPNYESLNDYEYRDTNFYFFVAEAEDNKKQLLKKNKNKLIAKFNNQENNFEWLLYVNKALGLATGRGIKIERLYNQLDSRISKIDNIDETKAVLAVFEKTPLDLEIDFVVDLAIEDKTLRYEKETGVYTFSGADWGATRDSVKKKFKDPQYTEQYVELKEKVLKTYTP